MESPFSTPGIVVYELDLILNFWLFLILRRKQLNCWFRWYTAARLAASVMRCSLFLTGNMDTYSRCYWLTSPVLIFFMLMVVCDFYPKIENWFRWVAVSASVLQLALVILRSNAAETVEGCANGIVAAFMFHLLVTSVKNGLAIGMFISTVFQPIWDFTPDQFQYSYAARFLPCYLFLAAQILWIRWARKSLEMVRA